MVSSKKILISLSDRIKSSPWFSITGYKNPHPPFRVFNFKKKRPSEAISISGFSFQIESMPRFNPPRLSGSSTRMLKYVDDLRRGLNADIARKDFFMATSNKNTDNTSEVNGSDQ
jgi:hypothetical protein